MSTKTCLSIEESCAGLRPTGPFYTEDWDARADQLIAQCTPSLVPVHPSLLKEFPGCDNCYYCDERAIVRAAVRAGRCTNAHGIYVRPPRESVLHMVRCRMVDCIDRARWAHWLERLGYPELGRDDVLWHREKAKFVMTSGPDMEAT